MKDLILEMHKQDGSQLDFIKKELEHFKIEAAAHGNTIDDDIAYRHAIYANELTALTSANAQLSLMSSLLPSDLEFTDSESDKSSSKAEAEKEWFGNRAEFCPGSSIAAVLWSVARYWSMSVYSYWINAIW